MKDTDPATLETFSEFKARANGAVKRVNANERGELLNMAGSIGLGVWIVSPGVTPGAARKPCAFAPYGGVPFKPRQNIFRRPDGITLKF